MTITPLGYWNYADWEADLTPAVALNGSTSATQINPAQPNNFVGTHYISVKDNTIRDGGIGIAVNRARDSVLFNNRIKYFSIDAIENYGGNGNWTIHNLATDVTFVWGHQDFDQFGTQSGVEASTYFADAAMENIGIQYLDSANYFPREMQGINTTDDIYWGMYVCCNLMVASTNGIGINGQYNTVMHNTEFPKGIAVGNQPKSGQTGALYSLLANNVANGVSRQTTTNPTSWTPNFCTVGAGDFNTVEGNVSIPVSGLAGAISSIYCTTNFASTGTVNLQNGTAGNWVGLNQWQSVDWQSNASVQALFKEYHPISGPVEPNPGWTTVNEIPPFNLCLKIPGLYTASACQTNGNVDLTPNVSFSGWTAPVLGTLTPGNTTGKAFNLPPSSTVGSFAITTTDGFTGGVDYPVGMWQYCPTGAGTGGCPVYSGSNPYTSANGWYFISATVYNPGVKNAGTNLGSGAPIADLFGHPWTSTPSVGAIQ